MSACNHDGNRIVADASVDASACASLRIGDDDDLDVLVGANLDVHLRAVVDLDGHLVVDLDD